MSNAYSRAMVAHDAEETRLEPTSPSVKEPSAVVNETNGSSSGNASAGGTGRDSGSSSGSRSGNRNRSESGSRGDGNNSSGTSFSFHHGLEEESSELPSSNLPPLQSPSSGSPSLTSPPPDSPPPESSPPESPPSPPLDDSLVPKPSSSSEDPLNWSWAKKHAVMLSLIPGSLLSDWTLTWGTTVFQLQAPEWEMSIEAVAQSVSPGIFMQGPGGILSVPLCQRYGRLPVLFWSQVLSLLFTIGAMVAPTYASFTAMRALQGFFGAAPQVIGLSIIHDMFFFNERTRKINIWAASFLMGPYLGPFISSLLLQKLEWRPDFAVLAGFYGLSVVMIVFFGDETLYDRDGDRQRSGCSVCGKRSERALLARIGLLLGVTGYRNAAGRPNLWTVFRHQCLLLVRPYLFLPTAMFVLPITMWTIGMVSTISQFVLPPAAAGGYGFSYLDLAMLYWAPMVGTLVAEFWGHWFNDTLARRYMKRFGPEIRLAAVYPAVAIGVAGLILFGQTLQKHLHWMGLAAGWAMLCFSTLACMTVVSAYTLDCFPQHAALAAAWINFWRVIGGFTVVYFQLAWVHRNGPDLAFGCQAAIIAGAALSIVATQRWGRSWRARFPAPAAEN